MACLSLISARLAASVTGLFNEYKVLRRNRE